MPWRLDATSRNFAAEFEQFLNARREQGADVRERVAEILLAVREKGDEALMDYTRQFDWVAFMPGDLKVSKKEINAAERKCPLKIRQALQLAAKRIEAYHRKQLPRSVQYKDSAGVSLGWKWTPVESAGMYVPGGKASYPSSVLMNAIPAKVAGVKRLVMAVPAPGGVLNPAVLAAAKIAGVDEVYRIGGAQAVAALAYGTQTITRVDKIVGPGNVWVAEAKRQIFGEAGIDMIAGPSEILVVADKTNPPRWIAADLLSQAEHDISAQSVLITDNEAFALKVEREIEKILSTLSRADIAASSWLKHGAIIRVQKLADAPSIINRLAPEHVELAVDRPDALAKQINHAGAIFLGRYTPEAVGDYIAGPSHVLPTARTARFSSVLSVTDFMKRISLIGCTQAALKKIGPAAATLAEAEGLPAHALSLRLRTGKGKP